MSIQNAKETIENMLEKIVDLAHTQFNSINSRTLIINQIKEEHAHEQTPMEVLSLNMELFDYKHQQESFSNEIMASTSVGISEK